jgi:hypothetical protein
MTVRCVWVVEKVYFEGSSCILGVFIHRKDADELARANRVGLPEIDEIRVVPFRLQ